MSRIYHYPLVQVPVDDDEDMNVPGDEFRFRVTVPSKAKFLSLRERQGDLVAYFRIEEEDVGTRDRYFFIVPTGAEFNIYGPEYLGTVDVGTLVFHIFSGYA